MNYQKIYQNLIENRKQNILESYVETHHIIPKWLGGTDRKENLVKLTAREHFVAHQLLIKIYPTSKKLIYAVQMMSNNKQYGSKKYAWLKEIYSESQTGEKNHFYGQHHSLESIQKMSGRIISEETKVILSARLKDKTYEDIHGTKKSLEIKNKISNSCAGKQNGMYGKHHSKESINNISESLKGRQLTEEHKSKCGHKGEKNGMYGKHHSKESIMKGLETKRKNKEKFK